MPIEADSPATAQLFILNPFSEGGLVQLTSTHPATAVRIARLQAMHREGIILAA